MARVLPLGNAPVTSPFMGGFRSTGGHAGVDFGGNSGDPIVAAASGTVVIAGWGGPYGWRIGIDHGDGVITHYAHMKDRVAILGETVQAGQVIGTVGSTGNSTGPHLDFEVRVNGQRIDPMGWLQGAQTPDPQTGEIGPLTMTRTGYRITPILPEEYIQNGQADIAALQSRFGQVAQESRFGAVAQESREGLDRSGEGSPLPPIPEAEIEWEDTQVTGGSTTTGGSTATGAAPDYSTLGASEREIVQNAYNLIKRAGGSDAEARFLASVVIPESGGVPTAVNRTSVGGSNATGLWQIMFPLHRGRAGVQTREQLFDPFTNAKVALDIYRDQGEGAWEVTLLDGGRHRKYLL